MNILKKILFIFVFIFVFSIFSSQLQAVTDIRPDVQVNFGQTELTFNTISCTKQGCDLGWIGQYVGALYRYGVGLAAVLAVVMIMVGGFIYLTAGGSATQTSKAKDFITTSMLGFYWPCFLLLFCKQLIRRW